MHCTQVSLPPLPTLQASPFTTLFRPNQNPDIDPQDQAKMVAITNPPNSYYIDYNKCPAGQIAILAGTRGGVTVKQASGQYLANQNNADNGAYGGKVGWQDFNRWGTGSSCWTVQTPIQDPCRTAAGGPYYNLRNQLASDTTPWLVVDSKNQAGMVSGQMPPATGDRKAPEDTDFCWRLPGYMGL